MSTNNPRIKWYQVLVFFALFALVVVWKVRDREDLQGRDVENRLEAFRKEACACPTPACAEEVGRKLAGYMVEIDGKEAYENQVDYFYKQVEAAQKCVADPSARKPGINAIVPVIDIGPVVPGAGQ